MLHFVTNRLVIALYHHHILLVRIDSYRYRYLNYCHHHMLHLLLLFHFHRQELEEHKYMRYITHFHHSVLYLYQNCLHHTLQGY